MFEVVEKWSNRDSEKSRIVATLDAKECADEEAQRRKDTQILPWSAFVVREVTQN